MSNGAPTQALIRRDDSRLEVNYTEAALALKTAALERSGLIARVSTPDEQIVAVEAQTALKSVLDASEKARKACKEPVLAFGKKIDDAARLFKVEIEEEMARISVLVGNFQALEQAKARAALQAQAEAASALEREKAAALAQAKSHEQLDAIQEHFNERAAVIAQPPAAPARAEGQIVKTDWNVTVTNPYELARFHPDCVNITPRLSEIKRLLNEGIQVKGIRAEKMTVATVRLPAQRKAIEV